MTTDRPPETPTSFESLLSGVDWPRSDAADLAILRRAGAAAIEDGLSTRVAVDSYLAAIAEQWNLAGGSGGTAAQPVGALLAQVRATLPVLIEAYQDARQARVPQEESERREFIDDLLRGDADVAGLIQRAVPFGLDLARAHQIVLVNLRDGSALRAGDEKVFDRVVVDAYGDRDVLVTIKTGYLLGLVPARGRDGGPEHLLYTALVRTRGVPRPWRIVAGRPYPGAYGIARSYEEAREAMTMSARLQPDSPVIRSRDLLIYRVLGRDRVAISDLVHGVLDPLTHARGGPQPLLETVQAYCDTGGVATATAERLHLSVRAVTYRLAKVTKLTGYDPADPSQRFVLHVAVLGARLLSWPDLSPNAASENVPPPTDVLTNSLGPS